MILLDYNGIAMSAVIMNKMNPDEDFLRHVILNSIRMYNKKYRAEFGQMVICCDGRSWRREIFPQYKYKRRESRDDQSTADEVNWEEIFRIINGVVEDMRNNFPYKVIWHPRAEADDVIGTLVERTQEFGQHDEIMIVSADKDFAQLQRYKNVKQYSPRTKKMITEKNPVGYLFEHICKGDGGDGIPNILSGDDTFVEGIRQKPMTKKRIDNFRENMTNLKSVMNEEEYRNFVRNTKLIDLTQTPQDIKDEINKQYDEAKPAHRSKVLNYLIRNRMKQLIESVQDFH